MLLPGSTRFPQPNELLSWAKQHKYRISTEPNLHIHTPYSFSAFADIKQAVELAGEQNISVLGISDFNTTAGYEEFTRECQQANVFPAYCMEMIALSVEDQGSGRRWNDPSNPGRIYFCGKGLRYSAEFSQNAQDILSKLAQASEIRVREMIDRMNDHLANTVPAIKLNYDYIRDEMAKGAVRERHIAKALQQAIEKEFPNAADKENALKALYGMDSKVDAADEVALQNELRSNLLKAGKVAFVKERQETYLSLGEAKSLVLDMGGIPCYAVLAAGKRNELNEVEREPELLADELLRRGIYCVEFIPTRNDIDLLREYVSIFRKKGIITTAGTEHNTPRMEPMIPSCSGGIELDKSLKEAFWKGACVVVAHQYLTGISHAGYVDNIGKRTSEETAKLEDIGEAVIAYSLNT